MTRREYNTCVDHHSDSLYGYALKISGESPLAQDLVQESFIKLWEHRKRVKVDSAKAYLFKILYHKYIDHLRKNKKITLPESLPEQSQDPRTLDAKDTLHKAFELLKESEKSILLLRDWEGYSYEEIGQILDLSLSQVKVYIFRARKKMRRALTHLQSYDQRNAI